MWTKKFWKATAERCVRGGAVAVFGAYFGADKVFDVMNVNTLADAGALYVSGAVGSLLLCLIGGAMTGDGPSITNQEELTPPVN
jgi:hypothetical protein